MKEAKSSSGVLDARSLRCKTRACLPCQCCQGKRSVALLAATSLALAGAVVTTGTPAAAASTSIIVTEVYGGGGNSGAPYTHDFIELTNIGTTPVDVTGWSIQYASAAGTSWANKINLTGTIAPGQAYLAQGASNAPVGQPLPPPDATGSVSLSATSGKVAVVTTTTSLTCTTGCATAAGVVDFVGYGATTPDRSGFGHLEHHLGNAQGPDEGPRRQRGRVRRRGAVAEGAH